MMLFVAGSMMMATSCSKDDDGGSNSSSIKGWYFTQTEYDDWGPGYGSVGTCEYVHIISDNYLEWELCANHRGNGEGHYVTPLEGHSGHSGWYQYGNPVGINFVHDGGLIVCTNGDTYSIDGNILRGRGKTYYKE